MHYYLLRVSQLVVRLNIFLVGSAQHCKYNALFSLLKSDFECCLFHKQIPNTEHEQVQMCNALVEKLRNNLRTEFSNAINRQKEEQENAERINLAIENLK